MNWKVIVFLVVLYGAYHSWHSHPVSHGDGVIAANLPQQHSISQVNPQNINGYQITPLADFSIQARVLSTEHYRFGREADLSPVDFALGWGRMSDEAVLKQLEITQSNRFYFWHVDQFPISREEIETHSANMHMVPADDNVKKALKAVRAGQVVNIEGYLIEARAVDGWRWTSSLTRDDTGNGACELVLVKSIHVT
jgi:hypothetical protein